MIVIIVMQNVEGEQTNTNGTTSHPAVVLHAGGHASTTGRDRRNAGMPRHRPMCSRDR